MRTTDNTACVKIEIFPTIMTIPINQKDTKEPNTPKGVQDKVKRRMSSKNPSVKRKFTRSSVKTSTSKLSTVDLLYVKSFNRLPRLRPPNYSNRSNLKAAQNFKMDKEYTYLDNSKEICRVSYPCFRGCATCAFSHCFGPVKVFFSQFQEPKECYVREIKDGQGRTVIPRSRRREFRGLVYDKQTHSLYPPLPRGHTSAELQTNSTRKIFY